LGSAQHLKHRFGDGFEVNIRTSAPTEEDVQALAAQIFGSGAIQSPSLVPIGYENIRLNKRQIINILRQVDLTSPNVLPDVVPQELEMMFEDDTILCRSLLDWILNEKVAKNIESFMKELCLGNLNTTRSSVEPNYQLLERSSAQNFKYRIKVINNLSLANIFRRFEIEKTRLQIQDYSIGQTTLEQIFNHFAASQENPEVAQAQTQRQSQGQMNPLNINATR
jgi:hypothetical protein